MAKLKFTKLDKSKVEGFTFGETGRNIYAKNLDAKGLDIRVLPPLEDAIDGLYFVTQIVYWANKKSYISHKSFGAKHCAIEELLDEAEAFARADSDKGMLKAISEIRSSKKPQYKMLVVPVLPITAKNGGIVGAELHPKYEPISVFVCGNQLMGKINEIIASGRGTDATDLDKGRNIYLEKTGSGLQTEYKATKWDEGMSIYDIEGVDDALLESCPSLTELHLADREPIEDIISAISEFIGYTPESGNKSSRQADTSSRKTVGLAEDDAKPSRSSSRDREPKPSADDEDEKPVRGSRRGEEVPEDTDPVSDLKSSRKSASERGLAERL